MSQYLETAQRAVRAAGGVIIERLAARRTIRTKGKRDIVTDADHAADRAIRAILRERFPRAEILSEESPLAERQRLWTRADAEEELALWIVDPLDGTTNYAHNLTPFGVSLGLYRAGAVQVGVVYDPMRGEMFAAERGGGAFCNGKRIQPSATRRLADAVIGMEWTRENRLRAQTLARFARLLPRVNTVRATGCAALSLCYIAAGRLDAYFHLNLSPWDVAAAALIIEEAGGRITTPTGARWNVHARAYVATNGWLHARLLRFFRT